MEPRRQELIESHVPLVDHIVRKVTAPFPDFVDRQELVAAGRLGLTEAALRYDFERGMPFGGFASSRIRGAVLDTLRAHDWVPRSVRRTVREADQATHALQSRLGREPLEAEVAQRVGVHPEELRRARGAARAGAISSLEHSLGLDEEPFGLRGEPVDARPDEMVERHELHAFVRAAVHVLPERLRLIVVGHYLEGRTLEELAVTMGVTPSRVSQLRAEAVAMMRSGIQDQFEPSAPDLDSRADLKRAQFAAAVAQHADHRARTLATRRYRESAPIEQGGQAERSRSTA